MKKQTFIKGAFLLALAAGLGKVFSAIFKVPLDRFFLHEDGMAIFNSAYNVYMFFYAVATAGIPLAISSMIASSRSHDEETAVLSTSLIFTTVFMGLMGVMIFVFAPYIAVLTGIEGSANCFRIMAPALIFCSLTASLKGFFQGKMMMAPAALSQVADSFGRLLLGFSLAYILLGNDLSAVAGGAISGVPFGAFLSALVLGIAFVKTKTQFRLVFSGRILKSIILLAIPVTLTTSLHAIFNMIDTSSVVSLLSHSSHPFPQASFGSFGRAAMLYALPVSIATAVAASALPSVAENTKNHDAKKLNEDVCMALRLSLVISLPCMAGFIAVPEDIFNLLFDSNYKYATLAFIAPSAVFLSFGCTLAGILQGIGKAKHTVVAAVSAIISKIVFNIVLTNTIGINGTACATSISYFVFAAVLVISALRFTSLTLSFAKLVIKPVICALVCYLSAVICSQFFSIFVSIPVAGALYLVSVFMTRFISWNEINQIFSAS